MKCPNCDEETELEVCEHCGTEVHSSSEDTMDALVQSASVPNLASLFKAGKDKGLIKPAQEYGHPA